MTSPYPAFFKIYVCGHFNVAKLITCWNDKANTLPGELIQKIDDLWQKLLHAKQAQHIMLFNGLLARLDEFQHYDNQLTLIFSETDYKTLMYSNRNIEHIIDRWGESFLCRALGVSALVITSDQKLLLMKRSPVVAEFPNMYDVFGGHVEPECYTQNSGPDVFKAISLELQQELTLLPEEHSTICIGLFESVPNRKPELVFVSEANLPFVEIIKRSSKAQSKDEYVEILIIENHHEMIKRFIKANESTISPSAHGCFWLYIHSEFMRVGCGY